MKILELAENLGLEEDEFLEMLDLFVEVSISDLSRLKAAFEKGEEEEVVEASHSIKGAAINLGLDEIAEVAEGIETNARAGRLVGALEAAEVIRDKLTQLNGTG